MERDPGGDFDHPGLPVGTPVARTSSTGSGSGRLGGRANRFGRPGERSMSPMSAPPTRRLRPPLPAGPFLVVGLARSGQAAARLLAARGRAVRGVDSGHPERRGKAFGGSASKSFWIRMDWHCSRGRGPSSRARAFPGRRR